MENSHHWVAAAPFRAHVQHLMAGSGLPWACLAAASGVPPAVVRTLVHGRDGRPRPHLRRYDAERLWRLTPTELERAARRLVAPHEASALARALVAAGLDGDAVARECRLSLGEWDLLLARRAFGVVETSLWRLRALAASVGLDTDEIRIAA